MVLEAYINAGVFFIAAVLGVVFGWYLANLGEPYEAGGGRPPFSSRTNETEQQQLFVNAGVLYATIVLVVGSVVSNWPPEGQQFPLWFDNIVFFVSVFVTVTIFVRIGLLIYRVESGQRLA